MGLRPRAAYVASLSFPLCFLRALPPKVLRENTLHIEMFYPLTIAYVSRESGTLGIPTL